MTAYISYFLSTRESVILNMHVQSCNSLESDGEELRGFKAGYEQKEGRNRRALRARMRASGGRRSLGT